MALKTTMSFQIKLSVSLVMIPSVDAVKNITYHMLFNLCSRLVRLKLPLLQVIVTLLMDQFYVDIGMFDGLKRTSF